MAPALAPGELNLSYLSEVPVRPLPIEVFESVETPRRRAEIRQAATRAGELLTGRVIWNVNSTAAGGGVAEMLRSLIGYAKGAGSDSRWLVIRGDPDFFRVTKRLHNHLHGSAGDGGSLGQAERQSYERALAPNARELLGLVRPQDVVLLHDPQTAGLIPALKQAGHRVIWRCHIGVDSPNELARAAWEFLQPYVAAADAQVFSRESFIWEGLDREKTVVIAPSIDAFSAKNRELDPDQVAEILVAAGIQPDHGGQAHFVRHDSSSAPIEHRAQMIEETALDAAARVVLQVSRWDRLKDPLGVITGFAEHVAPNCEAHLVYAGPAVEAVSDDPEGKEVLDEAVAAWQALPQKARRQIHLACLPMADGEENAAIVNALQRRADVVIQKSIAEGFGLTVAEAMWKAKPVVATRVGGIQDQIEQGRTGILLDDPSDLAAYGKSVLELIRNPERARLLGEEAQRRVRENFLGDRHLLQYVELIVKLLA